MLSPAGYHTHYPVLAAALHLAPAGRVLELGAGLWSTVMLHLCCVASGRHLTTIESNPEWFAQFERLQGPNHDLRSVSTTWRAAIDEALQAPDPKIALAFIDHAPEGERRLAVEQLRPHTSIFVMHDVDVEWDSAYDMQSMLATFKYVWTCKLVRPNTAIFSDHISFPFDDRCA